MFTHALQQNIVVSSVLVEQRVGSEGRKIGLAFSAWAFRNSLEIVWYEDLQVRWEGALVIFLISFDSVRDVVKIALTRRVLALGSCSDEVGDQNARHYGKDDD